MITEIDVLERLRQVVIGRLDLFLDGLESQGLDENSVLVDCPDPDSMRKDTMVYIQPDYASYQELTTSSDEAILETRVFIMCKGADSGTLVRRVFSLFSALYSMLKSDMTLGGSIDSSRITDMDYYPVVTASQSLVAIEVKVGLQWERRFDTGDNLWHS